MSRSIKLANNDYIDSTGIVHERSNLSDIVNYSLRTWNETYGSALSDYGTKTITARQNGVYLFINSHINMHCILLIMTWTDNNTIQIIDLGSNSALPSISLNNRELTITANGACRGYLFDLGNCICA